MVRSIVGGRDFDLTKDEVIRKMRVVEPETIREHFVVIADVLFPPKQALAQVTGWDRQTFTTMEAIRVLSRLGFICQRAGQRVDGRPAWVPASGDDLDEQGSYTIDQRVAALESALAVAQEAIAGLLKRVHQMEARIKAGPETAIG